MIFDAFTISGVLLSVLMTIVVFYLQFHTELHGHRD